MTSALSVLHVTAVLFSSISCICTVPIILFAMNPVALTLNFLIMMVGGCGLRLHLRMKELHANDPRDLEINRKVRQYTILLSAVNALTFTLMIGAAFVPNLWDPIINLPAEQAEEMAIAMTTILTVLYWIIGIFCSIILFRYSQPEAPATVHDHTENTSRRNEPASLSPQMIYSVQDIPTVALSNVHSQPYILDLPPSYEEIISKQS
ncbi:hypothetical protein RvY_01827 [Ramazzottius varieornatus]|uniref:Uncharacterized protein n=1 Tax=Ramazzottius varieornatus TaxID=947166 RepID=A0A1D1UPR3_RAMVA|nr:hypothetical protein RvY_01827 [Ramazzottius varieornatus]